MKRRFNYTKRKRIEREKISISLNRQNGKVNGFMLNKLELDDMDLSPDSKVYIEAYYRTELERFDFGTVGERDSKTSRDFTSIAYRNNLKFRILVVDPGSHRLLACADRIVPEEPEEEKSILPVEFKNLDHEIWRIEYDGDEGAPILCINKEIPGIHHIAKEPQFQIYVYPAVVREILTHMVFVEEESLTELGDPTWHTDWVKFSISLGVSPPGSLYSVDDNKDEILEWIEEVVKAFTYKYAAAFQVYLQNLQKREEAT